MALDPGRGKRGHSHRTGSSISPDQPLRFVCGTPDFDRLCSHRLNPSAKVVERTVGTAAQDFANHSFKPDRTRYPRGPVNGVDLLEPSWEAKYPSSVLTLNLAFRESKSPNFT